MMGAMRWCCLAMLIGCGPQTIGDLSRPALVVVVTEPGAFCSSTYAVDADDSVWRAESCGSNGGLVRQNVDAVDRADLDARMDVVLALSDDADCDAPGPSATRYRFERTVAGAGAWPVIRQCDPGVPVEARALAETMRLLASPGADAGADAGF
jgi:hypothetical protein